MIGTGLAEWEVGQVLGVQHRTKIGMQGDADLFPGLLCHDGMKAVVEVLRAEANGLTDPEAGI